MLKTCKASSLLLPKLIKNKSSEALGLFSPHTQSASGKARAILEHASCSKNAETIFCATKQGPTGASRGLSYAPTLDDSSNDTGKSNPSLGLGFLGAARAGSPRSTSKSPHALRIITNVPGLMEVLQMAEAQRRALSCKI